MSSTLAAHWPLVRRGTEECGTPLSGMLMLAGEVLCHTPKSDGSPMVNAWFVCLCSTGSKFNSNHGTSTTVAQVKHVVDNFGDGNDADEGDFVGDLVNTDDNDHNAYDP